MNQVGKYIATRAAKNTKTERNQAVTPTSPHSPLSCLRALHVVSLICTGHVNLILRLWWERESVHTSKKNLRLQISARQGSLSTQIPWDKVCSLQASMNIHHGTSIRRRGRWETLSKAETRLGGSDATEVAAGGRDVIEGEEGGLRSALFWWAANAALASNTIRSMWNAWCDHLCSFIPSGQDNVLF